MNYELNLLSVDKKKDVDTSFFFNLITVNLLPLDQSSRRLLNQPTSAEINQMN